MQTIYIVMIFAASLFAVLLLAYIIYACYTKRLNSRKLAELEKAYSDKNLAKMEYDVAVYDEETRNILDPKPVTQVTMDEVIKKDKADSDDDKKSDDSGNKEQQSDGEEAIFSKVDNEGMEEITGNFKGD